MCRPRVLSSFALSACGLAGATLVEAQLNFEGNEFQVNNVTAQGQYIPGVAAQSNGDFIVVWRDITIAEMSSGISARRFSADGAPLGDQFSANVTTTLDLLDPEVAVLNDDKFMIVWESDCCREGAVRDIGGRLFDADGAAASTEFRVNSVTDGQQSYPAIAALADGGFVVLWNSYSDVIERTQIRGRRFDGNANPSGTEFEVTGGEDGGQYYPAVAGLHGGGFITAYTDYYPDGDAGAVIAKRYGADGNQVGTEFQVNTYTTSYQTGPAIAVHADDSFVVVWTSGYQDGEYNGIFGQRFSAVTTPLGTEFQVNSYTTLYQGLPKVDVDDSGGFAVVWFTNSDPEGPSASEVAMRQYDADGMPVGTEFQVNQFTSDYQSFPTLAHLGGARFAVTWHDTSGHDGDLGGIFARIAAPSALCGDANGDGNRSASDALATLRTSVGTGNCPLTICDVNDSGSITASDALIVLQFAVGRPVVLNCPVA